MSSTFAATTAAAAAAAAATAAMFYDDFVWCVNSIEFAFHTPIPHL